MRESRLRWFGHVGRDTGYFRRRILEMKFPPKKKKGRPKSKFMGAVKGDHADCWHYGIKCKGQEEMKMDDLLWQTL